MSLSPCPECKREVSSAAVACPHCGHPRSPAEPEKPERWGCAGVGCLVLVVLVIAGAISDSSTSPTTTPPDTAWSPASAIYAAQEMCKKAGLASLKAPATAKWKDNIDSYGKDLGKGLYHVQLTVDAENGFGALLRNIVDCRVKRTGSLFRVTSMKMLEP